VSALYTVLAILGLIAAGLILFAIAWLFERVIEFAANLFDDEAREFANAADFGDVAFIHQEMRRAREGRRGEGPIKADAPITHTITEQNNTSLRTGTGPL
jgi:hypothetical protein